MVNRAARLFLLLGVLVVAGQAEGQEASPGVESERIRFGQSAALSGPASALGTEMQHGILAAFAEVNRAGGVNGRRLELVSLDDRYEPEIAVANTIRLIDQERVFALVGPVGTPTSMAAEPIATKAGVPMIGAFTGAEFLRRPDLSSVVNLRASYFQETEHIVEWLVQQRRMTRIGVLYQDDSYGRAGLTGLRQALQRRGLSTCSEGAYPRNTTAVKRALLTIRQGNPDAVVIIGAYQPSATFIKWARKLELNALFVNMSFVGTEALIKALGPAGRGTYISQVVPLPFGDAPPLVVQYRGAMAASDPGRARGFVSLEAYVTGRLIAEVLKTIDGEPTRAAFLAALHRIKHFDIGGFSLDYAEGDNQGSDHVFLTVIDDDGHIQPAAENQP